MKDEEPIGVAVGIREVELAPLRESDPQVLGQVVDLEGLEIQERRREGVVATRRPRQDPMPCRWIAAIEASSRTSLKVIRISRCPGVTSIGIATLSYPWADTLS